MTRPSDENGAREIACGRYPTYLVQTSLDDTLGILAEWGWAPIGPVTDRDGVTAARAAVDRIFAEPTSRTSRNVRYDFSAARLFELDPLFIDLVEHPLLVALARQLLGPDCHVIAQNVLRTKPGQAPFTHSFHIDEPLLFPVPPEMDSHPRVLQMPMFWLTIHIALSDIDEVTKGPTAYVPGSHYSGRRPNSATNPKFDGRGPQPALVREGEGYLHNGQCWHAALPNVSTESRYLLQVVYGARFVGHWFYPYIGYELPHEISRDPARDRALWGLHPDGPFS